MLINGIEKNNLNDFDLSKDQIIVIDDMYPDWFIDHVYNVIFSDYSWFYGHTSNYPEDPMYDVGADPNWEEVPALKQQIYPPNSNNASDSCFRMIYNSIVRMIPFELELGEILVNGQQYIHNTVPHQDCECDNGISWLYYVNRNWKQEWGGETRIKLNDEWHDIYPKPGRICLFKGNILHHGMPPNENYKGLRSSLVYKTMRKNPLPPRY